MRRIFLILAICCFATPFLLHSALRIVDCWSLVRYPFAAYLLIPVGLVFLGFWVKRWVFRGLMFGAGLALGFLIVTTCVLDNPPRVYFAMTAARALRETSPNSDPRGTQAAILVEHYYRFEPIDTKQSVVFRAVPRKVCYALPIVTRKSDGTVEYDWPH